MIKELWLNLPVKDIDVSRKFFQAIGIAEVEEHKNNPGMVALAVGNTLVMLFPSATFEKFAGHPSANTAVGSETLISFDCESKEEIDQMYARLQHIGAEVFGKPNLVDGWMYGLGFCDPDGHRWNMLFMDR